MTRQDGGTWLSRTHTPNGASWRLLTKSLPLRYLLLALPLFALFAFRTPADPPVVHDRAVAVAELFTSQGCSSCPPADRVLAELRDQAEREELAIITLSYHVDYWNRLGWTDPFSHADYSARQHAYTDRLKVRTYTPQLVINGRREVVGSKHREAFALVQQALRIPLAAQVSFSTKSENNRLTVDFTAKGGDAGASISVIAARRDAGNAVPRGENRGRDLEHVNVVRDLKTVDYAPEGSVTLSLPDDLAPADALVVVIVQRGEGGPVLAAASNELPD